MSSINVTLKNFNKIKDSLCCPLDEGMVEPRLGYDDEIIIYCLSCSWHQTLGLNAIDRISDLAHKLDT
jgi:hypothetical protein